MQRVVITGIGIWSCIGTTIEEVRDSLYYGKSGIISDPKRKNLGFWSGLRGDVPQVPLNEVLTYRQRQPFTEETGYGFMAAKSALADAQIDEDYLKKNDVGIIFGNDSNVKASYEQVDLFKTYHSTSCYGSGSVFQIMPSTISLNLACIFHLRGINLTTSSACASSSHAIGLATLLIQNGLEECILCGGAAEDNDFSIAPFDGIQAFSTRETAPQKASRPFDKQRDGLVPSGGAGALVLEDYEHAKKRGARIIAEVIGWGFSGNGGHLSTPNIDGPVKAIRNSILNSGESICSIDYINAHATSTIVGDAKEAQAITEVFGEKNIIVTSTKSLSGHELWAAGATEIVTTQYPFAYHLK